MIFTTIYLIFQFDVDPLQNNSSTMAFQGILCDNDIVYCLTGYTDLDVNKLLFAYNLRGDILFKKELTTGKDWANDNWLGGDVGAIPTWEPEGLALYNPQPNIKSLLVGICVWDNDLLNYTSIAGNFDKDTSTPKSPLAMRTPSNLFIIESMQLFKS